MEYEGDRGNEGGMRTERGGYNSEGEGDAGEGKVGENKRV